MQKTCWLFHEGITGNGAVFDTYEEADAFRKELDISLLEDPRIGEPMRDDEWYIMEIPYKPNFQEWIKGEE